MAAQAVLPLEARDNRVQNGRPHLHSAAAAVAARDQSALPAEPVALTAPVAAAVKPAEALGQTDSSL
jgi:hypothetical protein